MTAPARWVLPFITLTLLVPGCGGGGGGGGALTPPPQTLPLPAPAPVPVPAPAPAAVDVAAAWSNYVNAPHSWTMRGQGSDARAHQMTVEMTPGARTPFPMTGSRGSTTVQSMRFAIDGANTVSTVGTLFFTPQTMIGVATDDGACAAARSAMAPLPGASIVGATGPMFVLEGYAGCTISGQKLGTTTYKWSVVAEDSLTMFCITSEQKDGERANIGTEVDCMEASPDGTLGAKARFNITRPDGNNISGKNY